MVISLHVVADGGAEQGREGRHGSLRYFYACTPNFEAILTSLMLILI
jgi:hypothetical protein